MRKWNKILVCDKKKGENSFFLLRVSFLGLIAFMSARGQNDIQVISFPTSLSWEAFCSIFPILLPSSYFEAEKNKKSGLLSLESWVVKSHLKIQRRRPSPLLPSLSSSSSLPPPPLFEADTIHCFAPIRKAPRELSQGISYLKELRREAPRRLQRFDFFRLRLTSKANPDFFSKKSFDNLTIFFRLLKKVSNFVQVFLCSEYIK